MARRRQTWRAAPLTLAIVITFGVVSVVVIPVLAYLIYQRTHGYVLPAVLLVLTVAVVLYAWRFGLHPRIVADERGVRVVNPFRRARFDWEEITVVFPGENGLVIASPRAADRGLVRAEVQHRHPPRPPHPSRCRGGGPARAGRRPRPNADTDGRRRRRRHPDPAGETRRGPPPRPDGEGGERGRARAHLPARGLPLPERRDRPPLATAAASSSGAGPGPRRRRRAGRIPGLRRGAGAPPRHRAPAERTRIREPAARLRVPGDLRRRRTGRARCGCWWTTRRPASSTEPAVGSRPRIDASASSRPTRRRCGWCDGTRPCRDAAGDRREAVSGPRSAPGTAVVPARVEPWSRSSCPPRCSCRSD